ncbi:MAG: redoxin domain-containing protein, partial [Megasphaera micronuciformis]|nr:redoxin domain-containing protein [Megasphaera micronuciformis]
MMLATGTKAPDFTLKDQGGKAVSLSDFKGKKVVLYFYAEDDTKGCTNQAQRFAELQPEFADKNAV